VQQCKFLFDIVYEFVFVFCYFLNYVGFELWGGCLGIKVGFAATVELKLFVHLVHYFGGFCYSLEVVFAVDAEEGAVRADSCSVSQAEDLEAHFMGLAKVFLGLGAETLLSIAFLLL
jgi:hypothetical protein